MAIQDEIVVSPPPIASAGQHVVGRQGQYWKNGLYLVPTSDVDGRRRWETIIRLLSQKAQLKDAGQLQVLVGRALKDGNEQ